jgi:hypothetical protein
MSAAGRRVSMSQEATDVCQNPQMHLSVRQASDLTTALTHVWVCNIYCSVFGYITRLITSLRQECSETLMIYHSYTVQLLSHYNSAVSGR